VASNENDHVDKRDGAVDQQYSPPVCVPSFFNESPLLGGLNGPGIKHRFETSRAVGGGEHVGEGRMKNGKLEGIRQIHDFIESMDHSIQCLHQLKRQVGGRTVLTPINTNAFLTYLDTQLANLEGIRDGTVSRTAQMMG
jgi:hypothetical protein